MICVCYIPMSVCNWIGQPKTQIISWRLIWNYKTTFQTGYNPNRSERNPLKNDAIGYSKGDCSKLKTITFSNRYPKAFGCQATTVFDKYSRQIPFLWLLRKWVTKEGRRPISFTHTSINCVIRKYVVNHLNTLIKWWVYSSFSAKAKVKKKFSRPNAHHFWATH